MQTHRVWQDTMRRRDEARTLLDALLHAKRVSEQNLAQINRADLVKQVTGRSSMENAIESTRRLIESFDRVLVDLKDTLTDEDLAELESVADEVEAGVA